MEQLHGEREVGVSTFKLFKHWKHWTIEEESMGKARGGAKHKNKKSPPKVATLH